MFQFEVIAVDEGLHPKTSSNAAQVIIVVKRNINGPTFVGTPYAKSIQQAQEEESIFFTVRTVDPDDRVGSFLLNNELIMQMTFDEYSYISAPIQQHQL